MSNTTSPIFASLQNARNLIAQNSQAAPATNNGGGNSNNSSDRPKAMLWANIGRTVEVLNEDGDVEEHFIGVPVGIPLDTMKPISRQETTVLGAKKKVARNNLLEQLIAAGAELDPGEGAITTLEVQLYRVKEDASGAAEANSDDNPFLVTVA